MCKVSSLAPRCWFDAHHATRSLSTSSTRPACRQDSAECHLTPAERGRTLICRRRELSKGVPLPAGRSATIMASGEPHFAFHCGPAAQVRSSLAWWSARQSSASGASASGMQNRSDGLVAAPRPPDASDMSDARLCARCDGLRRRVPRRWTVTSQLWTPRLPLATSAASFQCNPLAAMTAYAAVFVCFLFACRLRTAGPLLSVCFDWAAGEQAVSAQHGVDVVM